MNIQKMMYLVLMRHTYLIEDMIYINRIRIIKLINLNIVQFQNTTINITIKLHFDKEEIQQQLQDFLIKNIDDIYFVNYYEIPFFITRALKVKH